MFRRSLIFSFLTFVALVCGLAGASAQRKPVITAPVDGSSSIILSGSKHPLAQPQFDAGPVDPATRLDRMLLVLGPTPQQEGELQTFLDAQQDKKSSNYHLWLKPEEFGQKFGPAPADIQALSVWLRQEGFTVSSIAKSGRWIEFSGTASQVERTFQTQMRHYQVNGADHIANSTDISVPFSVKPLVSGVLSLHNFFKKPMLKQVVKLQSDGQGTYTQVSPSFTSTTGLHALSPLDLDKIYNLPSTTNGVQANIAIVARSNIAAVDIFQFNAAFALSLSPVLVTPNGPDPGFDPTSVDAVEATLDTEWAAAIGEVGDILLVPSASTATTDGVDLSAAFIVDHNLAPIMSISFGQCETNLGVAENAFYNGLWQQAAAQGISVFVSSGDSGAAGCDRDQQTTPALGGQAVSGLASTPFNTAVGGTQFVEGATPATFWSATNAPGLVSSRGYIPEAVWSENCDPRNASCPNQLFSLLGGGGGESLLYAKPSWQSGGLPGMPADGHRDLPDVSLTAAGHDPYLICFAGSCGGPAPSFFGVSGTSASAPSFAGIMARIVNKMSFIQTQTAGRQGLANYQLYRIAGNQNLAGCNSSIRTNPAVATSCVFNDTTVGNNSVPGLTGFSATPGYDLSTGLGSVDATNLLAAWINLSFETTSTTITPASITGVHGQPIALNVLVTGATAPGPTGNVALFSSTNNPTGDLPLTTSAGTPTANFSGTVNNLPGGVYTLIARYPGDSTRAASDSPGISVNISPEASSVAFAPFTTNSSGQPVAITSIPYGGVLGLQATVTGTSGQGVATGGVTFHENVNTTIGTQIQLDQNAKGQEILSGSTFPASFTVGTVHAVAATYTGDASFQGGASTPINIKVTKGNPTFVVTPFQSSVVSGSPITVNGIVNNAGPQTPTGTIQFFEGTTALSPPLTIAPGVFGVSAQLTLGPADGPHSITATYSGDATYNSAVAAAAVVGVNAPFTIAGTIPSATVTAGAPANFTLTAIRNSSNFSGTISFACSSSTAITGCSFSPATVTLSDTNLNPTVTVTVNTSLTASNHSVPFRHVPFIFAAFMAGVLVIGAKRKPRQAALFMLALALAGGMSACGGGGSSAGPVQTVPRAPTNATITVTGTSGTQSTTVDLQLTLLH
jgi:hypothetical protein